MSKGGSDFHNLSASQVIEEKFSELSLFSVSKVLSRKMCKFFITYTLYFTISS